MPDQPQAPELPRRPRRSNTTPLVQPPRLRLATPQRRTRSQPAPAPVPVSPEPRRGNRLADRTILPSISPRVARREGAELAPPCSERRRDRVVGPAELTYVYASPPTGRRVRVERGRKPVSPEQVKGVLGKQPWGRRRTMRVVGEGSEDDGEEESEALTPSVRRGEGGEQRGMRVRRLSAEEVGGSRREEEEGEGFEVPDSCYKVGEIAVMWSLVSEAEGGAVEGGALTLEAGGAIDVDDAEEGEDEEGSSHGQGRPGSGGW